MSSEPTSSVSPKRTGTPFWVAAGFIAAFAATIVTVILTGLYVRAPGSRATTEQASPAAASRLAPGQETDESGAE